MGAEKIWLSLEELAKRHNLKMWRVYDLSRKGKLPIKTIMGEPVIPYQVDVIEFEKLVSTAQAKQKPSSLKIERKSIVRGHRKEPLEWP
jgi:hypothetical protein